MLDEAGAQPFSLCLLTCHIVSYRDVSSHPSYQYTPEDLPHRVFIPSTFVVPNCEVTVSILSLN